MSKRIVLILGALPFLAALSGCAPQDVSYADPDALSKLVRDRDEPYLLVDVRTAEEYAAGHIPTAVNIPVDVIAAQPPTKDLSALIVLYCRSGNRSATAKKALDGLGYRRVVDFGGVSRWKGALIQGDKP